MSVYSAMRYLRRHRPRCAHQAEALRTDGRPAVELRIAPALAYMPLHIHAVRAQWWGTADL